MNVSTVLTTLVISKIVHPDFSSYTRKGKRSNSLNRPSQRLVCDVAINEAVRRELRQIGQVCNVCETDPRQDICYLFYLWEFPVRSQLHFLFDYCYYCYYNARNPKHLGVSPMRPVVSLFGHSIYVQVMLQGVGCWSSSKSFIMGFAEERSIVILLPIDHVTRERRVPIKYIHVIWPFHETLGAYIHSEMKQQITQDVEDLFLV